MAKKKELKLISRREFDMILRAYWGTEEEEAKKPLVVKKQ